MEYAFNIIWQAGISFDFRSDACNSSIQNLIVFRLAPIWMTQPSYSFFLQYISKLIL